MQSRIVGPRPSLADLFGIRSPSQVLRDLGRLARAMVKGQGFDMGLSSLGLLRPDLSLPAYLGQVPADGVAPIFNFFDQVGGGQDYGNRVTRRHARDHRGGRLSYDQHDGTDFVCPPQTPLVAAAPGVAVAIRDSWLRGGLTLILDHGQGVTTQYSHLFRILVSIGQPLGRGQILGLSGVSGAEMTTFCPWVPPHLHFTVLVHGRPVDPFGARFTPREWPVWWLGGEPRSVPGPLPNDPVPPRLDELPVDRRALRTILGQCRDPGIALELAQAPHIASQVALTEDSLHHERYAWPRWTEALPRLRPGPAEPEPDDLRLSMPLPHPTYHAAKPSDTWFTRP